MAKRELSSTLKNLKFMQRASQKEEKAEKAKKEEEVKPEGNFARPNTQNRKCVVIMEGNPHPGALKGRMSFQSFNPSIDKLNEAAANPCQPQVSATSSCDGRANRENGSSQMGSEGSNISGPEGESDGDHKRKQPEIDPDTQYPNKSPRNVSGEGDQRSSSNNSKGSSKQQKREKLDWNLLRPPKAQSKRS